MSELQLPKDINVLLNSYNDPTVLIIASSKTKALKARLNKIQKIFDSYNSWDYIVFDVSAPVENLDLVRRVQESVKVVILDEMTGLLGGLYVDLIKNKNTKFVYRENPEQVRDNVSRFFHMDILVMDELVAFLDYFSSYAEISNVERRIQASVAGCVRR